MNTLLLSVGYGLVTASIIALSAIALSLQYGVSNIPNFAHGEFLTIGAYGALLAQHLTGIFVLDALIGGAAAGLVAWLVNLIVIESFVRRSAQRSVLFVVTIGTSLVLQNLITFFFGGQTQSYSLAPTNLHKVGPFAWTGTEEVVMVATLVIIVALYVLLRFTKFGMSMRAVADDRELGSVTGIKTTRVVHLTWLLAGFIAGIAGVVLAASGGSFGPTMGYNFLLVTFAAAIVGGVGKPWGALAGALIIGVATEVSASYLPSSYKQVIAVGVLVIVLLLRPSGLFSTTFRGATA